MTRLALMVCYLSLAACGGQSGEVEEKVSTRPPAPDIIATNAFYYYNNVDDAWEFYRDVLGFETVVDYGFAKIMRIAQTSYLTLVAADSGMHSAEEPKTVVLRIVMTNEFSLPDVPGLVDWVAVSRSGGEEVVLQDPEGYRIVFAKSNPDKSSNPYAAIIDNLRVMDSAVLGAGIRAAIYSIYMQDLNTSQPFYEDLFGRTAEAWPGRGALFHIAGSGFLNLIDGGDYLHEATSESAVTISFFSTKVDAWYERARNTRGFELRTPEVISESDLVRVFVGYDPEGIFLEWDTFLDLQENAGLMKYLGVGSDPHKSLSQ
ncbi:MAG: hypothetical protein BMS9Abin32_743 [Gammaproteobacteria bacterium]|nr:MAG: hypothetical protein BMS9Abin32_743 [Gammaproteobacteria bacterium]